MAKNEHKADDGTVQLDFDGYEETEIELPGKEEKTSSSSPKAEEKPEVEVEEVKADPEGEEDEHAEVSKNVKKRIDRLTKKMREAERREQEAVNYAKNVQAESNQLKQRVTTLDHGYLNEYGGRLAAEQTQAQDDLKKAMQANDPDGVVQAQTKIAQLAVSANEYAKAARMQERQHQQAPAMRQQAQAQPKAQPTQAAPPTRATDPKAEEWATRNPWVGSDEAMTFATFGIHKKMVEEEGFDPQSDEYYDEIDHRIAENFPEKIGATNGNAKKPVQTVAGGSRSKSTGRSKSKKVRLNPSQVAIAKKLGVPLDEYAKYVK